MSDSLVLALMYRAFAEVLAERLSKMNEDILSLRQELSRMRMGGKWPGSPAASRRAGRPW